MPRCVLAVKAQLPYPVNSIALKMALKLLTNIEVVNHSILQVKRERERLLKKLNEIDGVTAFPSQTNFILFYTLKDADEVFQGLLNQGLLVRNLGKVSVYDRCLRVTIGLPEMNNQLLDALRHVCRD